MILFLHFIDYVLDEANNFLIPFQWNSCLVADGEKWMTVYPGIISDIITLPSKPHC